MAGQPLREQRSHDRGKQSRHGCHGDGQCNITFGQIGNHVRRSAARRASHQDDAHGKFGRKAEYLRQDDGQCGHNDELCNHTDDDGERTLDDQDKIGCRQRQAHAEHDDGERNVDASCQARRWPGNQQSHDEGDNDDERENGRCAASRAVLRIQTCR